VVPFPFKLQINNLNRKFAKGTCTIFFTIRKLKKRFLFLNRRIAKQKMVTVWLIFRNNLNEEIKTTQLPPSPDWFKLDRMLKAVQDEHFPHIDNLRWNLTCNGKAISTPKDFHAELAKSEGYREIEIIVRADTGGKTENNLFLYSDPDDNSTIVPDEDDMDRKSLFSGSRPKPMLISPPFESQQQKKKNNEEKIQETIYQNHM
jgi:hypothetical protein